MRSTTTTKAPRARGERLLTDAKARTATRDVDGPYLGDGGGLRIRLLPPSRLHPRGAKLAEYSYRSPSSGKLTTIGLGTLFEPHMDSDGNTRPFTLNDARDARDAARVQVAEGIDPRDTRRLAQQEAVEAQRARIAELDSRRTVRTAFDAWMKLYVAQHRKDGGDAVQAMFDRDVLAVIGDMPLDALRRGHVSEMLDKIIARGARRTANAVLATLRQMLRWCLARDWVQADPTIGLAKRSVGGKETPRDRVLSKDEILALRDALPVSGLRPRMQHAIWLLLATGVRVGELSNAAVVDFDLDAGEWHLPETKNGKAHLVHLSPFALQHVRALIDLGRGSQWLLPARDPTRAVDRDDDDDDDADEVDDSRPISDKIISKAVGDRQRETPLKGRAKASQALVLPGGRWTCHDLRRSMATHMRDLGISSDTIERCLNHTPQGIVGTYQRGTLMADRRAAFDAWGAELVRLQTATRRTTNVVPMPVASARRSTRKGRAA